MALSKSEIKPTEQETNSMFPLYFFVDKFQVESNGAGNSKKSFLQVTFLSLCLPSTMKCDLER